MSDFIEGAGRGQQILFPDVVDDYVSATNPYVSATNPVRFIDGYVDGLDLEALGFVRAEPAWTGRPGYDPSDLLKLYIYGYVNERRSSRKLEREVHRNVELMWLLRKLRPDFKTIAEFRRKNGAAIRGVFREFTLLCKRLGLFGGELVAIDGSKFRAVNGKKSNYSRSMLEEIVTAIDKRIEAYLGETEVADREEETSPNPSGEASDKLEQLRVRAQECRAMLAELDRTGQRQISLTDPDSRAMKVRVGTDICYNVQTAVDEKNKLIVAVEVTNEATDRNWLSPMAIQAKQILGTESLTVVADTGYSSAREVKACLQENITPYLPKPQTSANKSRGLFTKDDFRYHAQQDTYICPAGETLSFRHQGFEKGRPIRYYTTSACRTCPLRPRCTRNKGTRRISRHADEHLLEDMNARAAAHPEILRRRKSIVEHPFGTIKRAMHQAYFLMKGLDNVRTEFSLSALAYNLKRVLTLRTIPELITALA